MLLRALQSPWVILLQMPYSFPCHGAVGWTFWAHSLVRIGGAPPMRNYGMSHKIPYPLWAVLSSSISPQEESCVDKGSVGKIPCRVLSERYRSEPTTPFVVVRYRASKTDPEGVWCLDATYGLPNVLAITCALFNYTHGMSRSWPSSSDRADNFL